MRKTVSLAFAFLGTLALLFSVSTGGVLAQGPANTSPETAVYFDNNPHYIAANSSLWYRFDYAGKSLIVSKMFGAANTGLEYQLWAPDQPAKPFGRGTSKNVPCGDDKCQDADLTWKGATPVAGAYYVEVVNNSSKPLIFYLLIVGEGVSFGPGPTLGTTDTLQTPTNISPDSATLLQNNQLQAIAGNTGFWYRFDHNGDLSPIVVTLVNGKQAGLYFRLFSADQAKQLAADSPFIGQGTSAGVACGTGVCALSDLNWWGTMPGAGTYYLYAYNVTPTPMAFRFVLEGTGFTQ